MKFICQSSVLRSEIELANSFSSSKNSLSISSNVLLEAGNDALSIKATDQKMGFSSAISVSVQVPGETTVYCEKLSQLLKNIPDTEIEVSDDAYACIEYCMGTNVTTVPTMTLDNVTFKNDNGAYAIWADAATFERVRAVLGEGTSDDGVLEYIKSCITNKCSTTIKMYVGVSEGKLRTVSIPVTK